MKKKTSREIDSFFKKMDAGGWALTFGDVRLQTDYSEVSPADVSLATKFSRNIVLKMPIVSSPMDTVTESAMAIAMAKEGGLGIIHRGLTPENQAYEIARVKHHLNGKIGKPIIVRPDQTITSVDNLRLENDYQFHSFPVVDSNGKLVGVVTRQDFEFCTCRSNMVSSIMSSKNLITSPLNTSLKQAYEIMITNKKKILPLIDALGKLVGVYVFSDVKRIITGSSAKFNTDKNGHLIVGAAIGTGDKEIERMSLLVERGANVIVIDTAHGDSLPVYETLKQAKKKFPDVDVVVGNVSVGKSATKLVKAGADGIKVGQGPGSICTTRIIAGIGRPQITAVYSCEKAIRGSGVPICADGGITYSGDITIALGAGANSVMLGKLLSGTKETPGDIITTNGVPSKKYRGMGSIEAMKENSSSRERYKQGNDTTKLVPEGVVGAEPYKGEVTNVLFQLLGGLRSGMGYVGAENIEELHKKANFDRITNVGLDESKPHDIMITAQAPNYYGGK